MLQCCCLICGCCSPGDEKEENDVEGQNQNHEEHMLSQYIPPDIDSMPEIPSDLTRSDNLSNFNDNKQVERNSPIPNLRTSIEDLRSHSNETPYLQEDRSESNINVQNPNKSDSVPEYVGEIDDFQSVPNNIATIVNESKVMYTDQPSAITSGQEKLATAYVLSTSRSDDYSSRNPDPYSDYSSRNPDPYDTSNT